MAENMKKNLDSAPKTQDSKVENKPTDAKVAKKADDKSVAPNKFQKVNEHARQDNRRQGGKNRRDRRDRKDEPKQFEEQTISIDRVARVVKGGRRFRFKALVVVGDRKNKVGVGVSKGQDVQQAVAKATDVAKKNMITVPIVNGTIPHDVEVKFTGARVLLKPAAPGTGVIAGGVIRTILGTIGVTNMLSKSLGSNNKVNIAYATIKALESLVPKEQWVGEKSKTVAKKEEK